MLQLSAIVVQPQSLRWYLLAIYTVACHVSVHKIYPPLQTTMQASSDDWWLNDLVH